MPGDIMVLQIDEDEQGVTTDNFIFVTFVDLAIGTTIYFTDCGIFPTTGLFTGSDYPACTEGATKFVVRSSIIEAGSVFQYVDGATGTQFFLIMIILSQEGQ
jgi:hypothetical protein